MYTPPVSFSRSEPLSTLLQSVTLAFITTLLLTISGCDFGSETYTASGTIINSTDRGVDNAQVEFSTGGSSAKTTTTNDSGYYEVSGLSGGDYDVSVTANGYEEATFSVSINSNSSIPDQELLGPADVSGTVAVATTGEVLSNAEVAFTFGEDPDTSRSAADLITTTSSDGSYSISNAPTGQFVCVIRAPGFIPAVIPNVQFESGTNNLGQASTSEPLAEGELRIVLAWGETPSDLDSHLTGPSEDGDRFHLYWANQEPIGAGANLDVDDITSYGPETVTITNFRSGTYRYSVHNYSNWGDDGAVGIDNSPARVTVYDASGQVASYSPPDASDGDGNTWRVLEIAGGSVSIDDNGGDTFGYYFAESDTDVTVFSRSKQKSHTPEQERILQRIFDRPFNSF